MRRALILAALLLAALATSASSEPYALPVACAPGTPTTRSLAVTTIPGSIGLHLFLVQGAPVTFYECHDGVARNLGTAPASNDVQTVLDPAAFWRCDRLSRSFAAEAQLPDGTTAYGTSDVRTTSCAHRFTLSAPERARRGTRVRATVLDGFGLGGVKGRICVTPPGHRARCHPARFGVRVNAIARGFEVGRRGDWKVDVRLPDAHLKATIAVGVKPVRQPRLPEVLATGDSTMIGTGSFITDDLTGRAQVSAQPFPGVGISLRDEFRAVAEKQVADLHPDLTVLSIGANEGFAMNGIECCGADWIAEYARRLRRTVRVYLQHGRGHVVLLTIQLPEAAERVPTFRATNDAIKSLTGMRDVDVLPIDEIFTPNGYTETITYRGRTVDVREPDGIHLNLAGTSIAARAVVDLIDSLNLLGSRSGPGSASSAPAPTSSSRPAGPSAPARATP